MLLPQKAPTDVSRNAEQYSRDHQAGNSGSSCFVPPQKFTLVRIGYWIGQFRLTPICKLITKGSCWKAGDKITVLRDSAKQELKQELKRSRSNTKRISGGYHAARFIITKRLKKKARWHSRSRPFPQFDNEIRV
jgi:hypothetical protein